MAKQRTFLRFSIFQLLVVITVTAFTVVYFADRVKYPYKSKEDTMRAPQPGSWQFREFVGSCDGPFRGDDSCIVKECGLKLTWMRDGAEHEYKIPESDRRSELILRSCENKSGDRFFVLFEPADKSEK